MHSKSRALECLVEKMDELKTNLIEKQTTIENLVVKIKDLETINENVKLWREKLIYLRKRIWEMSFVNIVKKILRNCMK